MTNRNIDILVAVAQKGGVENVINMTAPFLYQHGYYVRVVQLVFEGAYWTASDIPFFPLLRGREGITLQGLSDAYQAFLQSEEGKSHPPDLVLACAWPYMTYIAKNVASNLGLSSRVVSWCHSPVEDYERAGYGGYEALSFADTHFAISNAIADSIRTHLKGTGVVRVYNPVVFPIDSEPYHTEEPCNMLYYIGRLAVEKNVDLLIRGLARSGAGYHLTIIGDGDGDERSELQKLAEMKGIGDKVFFAGWKEHPWLEVKHAAGLMLPAQFGGFDLVLVEALARGIPVISTPVAAALELIIPGKNGYLFPVGDERMLADILSAMWERKFPPIREEDCISCVTKFEFQSALGDFAEKIQAILCFSS